MNRQTGWLVLYLLSLVIVLVYSKTTRTLPNKVTANDVKKPNTKVDPNIVANKYNVDKNGNKLKIEKRGIGKGVLGALTGYYAMKGLTNGFGSGYNGGYPSMYNSYSPYSMFSSPYSMYSDPYSMYSNPYSMYSNAYSMYSNPYSMYSNPYSMYSNSYSMYSNPCLMCSMYGGGGYGYPYYG